MPAVAARSWNQCPDTGNVSRALARDVMAEFAAFGLEQRGGFGDGDGFGGAAQLEPEIDAIRLRCRQIQTAADRFLKSRDRNRHLVCSDRQFGNGVISCGGARGSINQSRGKFLASTGAFATTAPD